MPNMDLRQQYPINTFLKLRMYHSYISMVRGFLLCIFLISSHCRAASWKGRVRNCNGVITLIKISHLARFAAFRPEEVAGRPAYLGSMVILCDSFYIRYNKI